MQDRNAKAPKSRKQEVSPLLGSIVKITSLLVIAALVVLITVIVVKFIQNRNDKKIFEDRIEISLNDYKIITNMNNENDFADIENEDVKNIVDELVEKDLHEKTTFYFFFYYVDEVADLKKEKELVNNINSFDEDFPVFIVRLNRDTEEEKDPFSQYLPSQKERFDDEYDFDNVLGRYKWFTIAYNFESDFDKPLQARLGEGSKILFNELVK